MKKGTYQRVDYSDPFSEQNYIRFWSKVSLTANQDLCWEWNKFTDKDGYGLFQINKKAIRANRFAYLITKKELPDDMMVCHTCDNPKCVNPSHLFLGTAKDNIQDCVKKGRKFISAGELCGTSKLKEDDVKKIFELWKSGLYTKTGLAKMFNLAQPHVSRIINGNSWKYLSRDFKKRKIIESDIADIFIKHKGGRNYASIAKDYNVSPEQISNIIRGKFWKHLKN